MTLTFCNTLKGCMVFTGWQICFMWVCDYGSSFPRYTKGTRPGGDKAKCQSALNSTAHSVTMPACLCGSESKTWMGGNDRGQAKAERTCVYRLDPSMENQSPLKWASYHLFFFFSVRVCPILFTYSTNTVHPELNCYTGIKLKQCLRFPCCIKWKT